MESNCHAKGNGEEVLGRMKQEEAELDDEAKIQLPINSWPILILPSLILILSFSVKFFLFERFSSAAR